MLCDALLSKEYKTLPEDHLSIANLHEQGRIVAGSSATSFPYPDTRLCIDDSHLLQFTLIFKGPSLVIAGATEQHLNSHWPEPASKLLPGLISSTSLSC